MEQTKGCLRISLCCRKGYGELETYHADPTSFVSTPYLRHLGWNELSEFLSSPQHPWYAVADGPPRVEETQLGLLLHFISDAIPPGTLSNFNPAVVPEIPESFRTYPQVASPAPSLRVGSCVIGLGVGGESCAFITPWGLAVCAALPSLVLINMVHKNTIRIVTIC
jgi:hypothetical protein